MDAMELLKGFGNNFFRDDGEDFYPKLRLAMEDPEIYAKDKVRFELLRHFGYFSTESSGHASEYIPYIRKRSDLIDKFCSLDLKAEILYNMSIGMSGAALKIGEERLRMGARRRLDDLKRENLKASDEYAVKIIDSIENDKTMSANLNVINNGLITDLPSNCCVEVPCVIDGGGIAPETVSNYPEQLAALNRGMINAQLLGATGALECDRKKVFQAIALDPLTAAVCSLDEIGNMTNELFESLKNELDKRFYN
jgi:alpha-galactosidase